MVIKSLIFIAAFIDASTALNEVLLSMGAQIEDQIEVPVFMKDLKKLCQQKLSYLEAAPDFIDNAHVTRLKKEIFKRIPRLFE